MSPVPLAARRLSQGQGLGARRPEGNDSITCSRMRAKRRLLRHLRRPRFVAAGPLQAPRQRTGDHPKLEGLYREVGGVGRAIPSVVPIHAIQRASSSASSNLLPTVSDEPRSYALRATSGPCKVAVRSRQDRSFLDGRTEHRGMQTTSVPCFGERCLSYLPLAHIEWRSFG